MPFSSYVFGERPFGGSPPPADVTITLEGVFSEALPGDFDLTVGHNAVHHIAGVSSVAMAGALSLDVPGNISAILEGVASEALPGNATIDVVALPKTPLEGVVSIAGPGQLRVNAGGNDNTRLVPVWSPAQVGALQVGIINPNASTILSGVSSPVRVGSLLGHAGWVPESAEEVTWQEDSRYCD